VIEFENIAHGFAIAGAIPRNYNPDVDHVISNVGADGRLLGGIIYDGCTGPCIFAHQAAFDKHWLSRDMLWVVFDYPFNQLGCKKICGTIPSGNPALLAFNKKLGFSVEATIKDAYPDGDMLVLSMKRSDCRWLSIKPRGLVSNLKGNTA
jgi:RimJ/RimL family protein N-acetyltransferase